jgi:hypothetical protein
VIDELPAPLVPVEVDLRGLGGFMLRTDRLLSSELVALGNAEECWAAVLLWCRAWQQAPAASLPNDDRVLASFSGAGRRWKLVKAMAMRGFVLCSDNRWYHRVLAEEALEAWSRRIKFRERSDKANNAKRNLQGILQGFQQGDPQGLLQGDLKGHEGKGRGSEGEVKGSEIRPSPQVAGSDASLPTAGNGKAAIYIPLVDGSEFPIPAGLVVELERLYPAVDAMQTLREIRGWSITNPSRRKTGAGILRHINTWFAKEQNRG